jgi:hypothetical protein
MDSSCRSRRADCLSLADGVCFLHGLVDSRMIPHAACAFAGKLPAGQPGIITSIS